MQLDPRALHIRTDGSCYRKQRMISGCAAIVEYPDHLGRDREQIVDFGCAESNVARMELLAVIRALRWVRENRPWGGVTRVQIISDSTYVTDNISRARGWRKNGWRNRYDEPMQNPDLWREFFRRIRQSRHDGSHRMDAWEKIDGPERNRQSGEICCFTGRSQRRPRVCPRGDFSVDGERYSRRKVPGERPGSSY